MFVLPVIPYPAINPVLVSIGPLAIRWYALAYIVGIIAGWFYARAIIASQRLWGGPAPFTVTDFDDFRRLDHARHHPRRPHRLCAVLQPPALRHASGRDPADLERRHVVSRRRRRLRPCRRPVCLAKAHSDLVARRRLMRRGADRIVPRPHRQFHQRRTMGPADRRALGDDLSLRRAVAAPSEPALRGGARGHRAVHRPQRAGAARRAEAAGRHHRRRSSSATGWRAAFANSSANRMCSSAFCGAPDG